MRIASTLLFVIFCFCMFTLFESLIPKLAFALGDQSFLTEYKQKAAEDIRERMEYVGRLGAEMGVQQNLSPKGSVGPSSYSWGTSHSSPI